MHISGLQGIFKRFTADAADMAVTAKYMKNTAMRHTVGGKSRFAPHKSVCLFSPKINIFSQNGIDRTRTSDIFLGEIGFPLLVWFCQGCQGRGMATTIIIRGICTAGQSDLLQIFIAGLQFGFVGTADSKNNGGSRQADQYEIFHVWFPFLVLWGI